MIKAVVFDLDGVLVDAGDWHFRALNSSLRLFGHGISAEEHTAIYNGLPTAVKLDLLSQRNRFPKSLHSFVNEMKQKYTREIIDTHCKPRPEKTAMLAELEKQGFLIALGSNCLRSTIDHVLKKMGIHEYFDVILSQEDVGEPKPASDIYRRCVEMLGVRADETLIVEDSEPGIQAARGASPHVLTVTGPDEVKTEFILTAIAERAVPSQPTLEIVVPMAGLGTRFSAAGYANPKPFIEVWGKPMIEWVVNNVRPTTMKSRFTFLVNEAHLHTFPVRETLERLAPGCSIVSVPSTTEGAACTVLLAADAIDQNRPMLLVNSDQFVESSIDDFLSKTAEVDGSIMTFRASETKWSYAKIDAAGRVTRVAEKDPISPHATVGIYYFRRGRDFIHAAQTMIRNDIRVNNEFYVCPVYNDVIEAGGVVSIHEISRDAMHGLGTPEDLIAFLGYNDQTGLT